MTGTSSTCASGGGDCDDTDAAIHPGAAEICDAGNVDEDCDGLVNEEGGVDWYTDADGDGYGCASCTPVSSCSPPNPTDVRDHTDCDDARIDVNPAAPEVCDDADNDCDSSIDEDCDDDNDGYCDASAGTILVYQLRNSNSAGSADMIIMFGVWRRFHSHQGRLGRRR